MDTKTQTLNNRETSKFQVHSFVLDQIAHGKIKNEIKVMCWNIERGYVIDKQVEEILKQDPDILLLQEVDNKNERTQNLDVGLEIARKVQMRYYAYATEFVELKSIRRSALLQGGGTHGNAIISRYPITKLSIISLPQGYDWSNSIHQPREGGLN